MQLLKLVSGDMVISDEVGKTGSKYVLRNPAQLMITPNGPAMLIFPMFTKLEKQLEIDSHSVICCEELDDYEVTQHYQANFGNGIVTPPEKSLIL